MRVSSRRSEAKAAAEAEKAVENKDSTNPAENTEKKSDPPAKKAKKPKKEKAEKQKAEANGEAKPAENGDGTTDKKEGAAGDAAKTEEKAKKPLAKCLPPWVAKGDGPKTVPTYSRPALTLFKEAIDEYGDGKGQCSARQIANFIEDNCGEWPKKKLKVQLEKAVSKGQLELVKGNGLSGTYRVAKAKGKKGKDKEEAKVTEPLENYFANIFTWVTNPKESSIQLIRKYINLHYPKLDANGNAFRKAIESGENKGQLSRITGFGQSGTMALVDGAKKTGTDFEDAIEDAVIAMNEPKEVSITSLRDYLDEYYPEYKTNVRPKVLKAALDRAEERGWIIRISGKGFTGKFRLCHTYQPAPPQLWGKWYEPPASDSEEEEEEDEPPRAKKAKKTKAKAKVTYDEELSDDDFEDDYVPKKKSRGAPKKRSDPPAKGKKAAKPAAPAKGQKAKAQRGRKRK